MQYPSETSSQALFGKEWLVKIDSTNANPYLFKFVSSIIGLTCCVLFTDTKSVWVEELTSQQLARRWREYNSHAPSSFSSAEDEDEWRTSILELLTKAHTLGCVDNLSFEVAASNYSDMAFALECESFRWRWETCFVGHKISADIISKHLVLPLISTNHMLFSLTEPIQGMTDTDIEKAVDKVGRTARRAMDTHVKNVLSKPRVSTILRRVTAMFNSLHDLPSIVSMAETPDLQVPLAAPKASSSVLGRGVTSSCIDVEMKDTPRRMSPAENSSPQHASKPLAQASSATETESSAEDKPGNSQPATSHSRRSSAGRRLTPARSTPPMPSQKRSASAVQSSTAESSQARSDRRTPEPATADKALDEDSSSPKPTLKKTRPSQASSSDSGSESDSESERKARITRLKSGGISGTSGTAKRGVRQPIKRGAKRF